MTTNRPFNKIFEETSDEDSNHFNGINGDDHAEALDGEDFPLVDDLDQQIVMHRDAHFSGSFDLMIEYYKGEGKGEGKGTLPELEIPRMKELAIIERDSEESLSSILLDDAGRDQVAKAKDAYFKLRAIYEVKNPITKHPQLIADLILSEEVDSVKEIETIVAEGPSIVPALINLLVDEDFLNPLSPGYGYAPAYAAICLGLLKDARAIRPLFERMSCENSVVEESVLVALEEIGEESKVFCLKVLQSRPITYDNENAAIILASAFLEDPETIAVAKKQIEDPAMKNNPLIFQCLSDICPKHS